MRWPREPRRLRIQQCTCHEAASRPRDNQGQAYMYPDGPLLTRWRTTLLSESGNRAGSRHPLRAAGLVSSSRITFYVAESKRRVRPRRYDTLARCTSVAEMCPSSAGAFRSSFLRLRTQSMKFAKVPSGRFGVPGYFWPPTRARCIRPCKGWNKRMDRGRVGYVHQQPEGEVLHAHALRTGSAPASFLANPRSASPGRPACANEGIGF